MEIKTIADIIGYIFCILAIIIGCHTILTNLFHYSLFSVFLALAPLAVKSFVNVEELAVWLQARTPESEYHQMWSVTLFYLVLLAAVLFIMVGCWVFLLLNLLSITHISVVLLTGWFVFNCIIFFISAINQTAVQYKIFDRRLKRVDTIITRMTQQPLLTLKLILKFSLTNWFLGPITTLKVWLIIFLLFILYWPVWIIQLVFRKQISFNNEKAKNYYYIAYAAILAALGTSISFFF